MPDSGPVASEKSINVLYEYDTNVRKVEYNKYKRKKSRV